MPLIAMVLICAGCFILGAASIIGILFFSSRRSKKKKQKEECANKPTEKKEEKKNIFSRLGVMNLILIVIAVTLLVYVITMINLFREYGTVPDTLIVSVFAVCGTECGAMSWIKTNKDKQQQRKWDLEDEERMYKRERQQFEDHNGKE